LLRRAARLPFTYGRCRRDLGHSTTAIPRGAARDAARRARRSHPPPRAARLPGTARAQWTADPAVGQRRHRASLSRWGSVPARRRLPLFWRRDERAPKPKSSARRFVAPGGRRAPRLRRCNDLAREDGDLARVVSGAAALPITRLGAES